MKIILLGSNGMLGSMVHFVANRQQLDILPLTRTQFDAEKDSVDKLNTFLTPDSVVVNCIGAIPQKKPSDAVYEKLNTIFPNELAALCASKQIPLLHISTNCVFSGKQAYYTEKNTPDAEDFYGQSKAKGEPNTAVVLRCSIIGFEKTVQQYGLLGWYASSKGLVNGFTDHYWNGLTTYELAKTIFGIIERKEFTPRLEHHLSNNTFSKHEILQEIAKHLKEPATIVPMAFGVKHYTLGSMYNHTQHPCLQTQIQELFSIQDAYNFFHRV